MALKNPPAKSVDKRCRFQKKKKERDAGSIPGSGRSSAGGHGNPLQHSCLENPMDRGAWWAAVLGVTKSQTRLKRLSMHTRRWQRGRDPRRKRRPGGLCCALSGAPELHLGSPLSPLSEPMPRCSSLPRSSSTRFSLGPVLTPSCPPQSPGLQPQEEEAGGLCASMIHPLRSQSVCQPASPTHSGLGLLPWGVASIKPWEQLWCLRKRKMVLPGPRKLRGIRIPGVRVLHLS